MSKTSVVVNLENLTKFRTTTVRIIGTTKIAILRWLVGNHDSMEFFVIHTNPRVELVMFELDYVVQMESCVDTRQKLIHDGINELLEEPVDIHGQIFINGAVLVSEKEDGLLNRGSGGLFIEDFEKFADRANTISTVRQLCMENLTAGIITH